MMVVVKLLAKGLLSISTLDDGENQWLIDGSPCVQPLETETLWICQEPATVHISKILFSMGILAHRCSNPNCGYTPQKDTT